MIKAFFILCGVVAAVALTYKVPVLNHTAFHITPALSVSWGLCVLFGCVVLGLVGLKTK